MRYIVSLKVLCTSSLFLLLAQILVAGNFTVTSDANGSPSDGVSLRWAITQANSNAGQDTIFFNIPGISPRVISLTDSLPSLQEETILDGSSQPANGYSGTSPKVVLDGGNGIPNGFRVSTGPGNIFLPTAEVIQFEGIHIRNFTHAGILHEDNLDSLIISNSQINGCQVGVLIDFAYSIFVYNSLISNCDSTGLSSLNGRELKIQDSEVDSCGLNGIETGFANGVTLTNCEVSYCGQYGFLDGGQAREIHMSNIHAHHCETGIGITGGCLDLYLESSRMSNNTYGLRMAMTIIINALYSRDNQYLDNHRGFYFPEGIGLFYSRNDHVAGNGIGYFIRENIGSFLDSCIIGLDSLGLAPYPNDTGVYLGQSYSLGIERSITNSVISANTSYGIFIDALGSGTIDTFPIANNLIGTDITGTMAMGNGLDGIHVRHGHHSGFLQVHDNVISGNGRHGVVTGNPTVSIYGNKIGVDASGTQPLPNDSSGIVLGGDSTFVGNAQPNRSNTIAFNKGNGVTVQGQNNPIRFNQIYCNEGEGIAHVNGGNGNYPAPDIVEFDGFSAYGTANPGDLVDLYQTDSCNCNTTAQGKTHLGTVATDSSGNWTYSGSLPPSITATATDQTSNHTSTFTPCCAGPPIASYSANNLAPLSFEFQNSSTANSDSSQVSWQWDFGDGNTSTAFSPTHTYASPGNYLVCLYIDNACGLDTLCTPLPVVVTASESLSAKAIAFPNPSTGLFNLEWTNPGLETTSLEVFDLAGRHILSESLPEHVHGNWSLDLRQAPSGNYLVYLKVGKQRTSFFLEKRN